MVPNPIATFLRAMLSVCVALLVVPAVLADDRPSIVLVMVDDMGYSDIGCYGGEVRTPHLDALAERGLRFTQFYNTGRCCPTRASLMTGLYPHQAGVGGMVSDQGKPGYRGRLNEQCVTIAEVLRPAGYQTFMSGKWHVTPFSYTTQEAPHRATWPRQRGFDRFWGSLAGGGSFYRPMSLMEDNEFLESPGPDSGFYYTDEITDAALRFVTEAKDDEPFFLYVAYTAPHWPLHALAEDVEKYRGVYDEGWDALRRARHARMKEMGLVDPAWELTPRDARVPAWEDAENKAWRNRCMEVYAAQIDRVDQNIGRLVETLREQGRLDNTLLMFLADNGGCSEVLRTAGKGRAEDIQKGLPEGVQLRGGNDPTVMPGPAHTFASYGIGWANASNTPFRLYKKNSHEGGVATPFIVHWPAGLDPAKNGQWRTQPGHVIDVMATVVEVADAKYPQRVGEHDIYPPEGVSLTPAFADAATKLERDAIYFEHMGHQGVRVGDWKLVKVKGQPWELFDLTKDRTEMHDLAGQYPERVERLATRWQAWAERCNVR